MTRRIDTDEWIMISSPSSLSSSSSLLKVDDGKNISANKDRDDRHDE
jgi:hypothetical protein